MKKLAFGGLFIGLLAACGGGDDGDISLIDAGDETPDMSEACNPVAQTGCGADEKCTWITIDAANDVGTLGCVPDGSVATGSACTQGTPGETTGYDNCQAGNICIYSVCEEICTDSPDSCGSTSSCSSYSGLFPDTSSYGACDFLCDPVAQTRDIDDAAACGSTAEIARACYSNPGDTFSCTGVPPGAVGLTHGEQAYGPASGGAYINGCDAGYSPLLAIMNDSMIAMCTAFCTPSDLYVGLTTDQDGVAPHTCNARNAIPGTNGLPTTDGDTNVMECHYFWYFEDNPNIDHNEFGFCIQPNMYTFDHDGNTTTAEIALPNCVDVQNSDTGDWGSAGGANNGQIDTLDWGCVELPAAANGAPVRPNRQLPLHVPNDEELKRYFH